LSYISVAESIRVTSTTFT